METPLRKNNKIKIKIKMKMILNPLQIWVIFTKFIMYIISSVLEEGHFWQLSSAELFPSGPSSSGSYSEAHETLCFELSHSSL